MYIHSEVPTRVSGGSGLRRTQHRPTCAPVALLASLAATKKFRSVSGGASRALDRPQEPFWRSDKAPGRPPGPILGPKMVPRRHLFAACWRSVLSSSEVHKTLHWLTKIEVRAFHARAKKMMRFPNECCSSLWAHSTKAPGRSSATSGPSQDFNLAPKTNTMAPKMANSGIT